METSTDFKIKQAIKNLLAVAGPKEINSELESWFYQHLESQPENMKHSFIIYSTITEFFNDLTTLREEEVEKILFKPININ